MKPKTPKQQAIDFIAAYDGPDADRYDKEIVRIARSWLSILASRHSVQRVVDRMLDELENPPEGCEGCGWDDLRKKFRAWAVAEDWIATDRG